MSKTADSTQTREPVIALIGNPNTGKSTLYNRLCGAREKTGNYPGVTIERKVGILPLKNMHVRVTDLPGSYSLKADSYDEQVVSDALMGRFPDLPTPDLILFVLDATNLRRNLYFYSQIVELNRPIIIALTMTDVLAKEGIELDAKALEKTLGTPVVAVGGGSREAMQELENAIESALANASPPPALQLYPRPLEKIVDETLNFLNSRPSMVDDESKHISRFEARNLIFYRKDPLGEKLEQDPETKMTLETIRAKAREAGLSSPAILAAPRYAWTKEIANRVEKRKHPGHPLSRKIDSLLTHRFLGPVIFAGIMYVLFSSIYFLAAPIMEFIELVFRLSGDAIGSLMITTPMLRSLAVDGVISGVGSVIVFLPQIAILFLFIAVLEDSGYLARTAFIMDRLLGWSGLNGRAFIPMLSSFACAVPGVMSARVMTNPRARLATVLIAPLMSCSARLPVYVLLIGAFIEPEYGAGIAGLSLFGMHLLGAGIALPIAWLLNRGLLKTPAVPFLLELPPYRQPNPRTVYYRVSGAVKKFTMRAGTVIFAMTIIIWALTYFPREPETARPITAQYKNLIASSKDKPNQIKNIEAERDRRIAAAYLENSYLGRTGRFIQPIFAPLGYDWKITVGILGAFPAREVIIATLGIIYSAGDVDEKSTSLRERMRQEKRPDGTPLFTPLLAVSIMVFFALCCQCLSTVITVQRELNSWKWAGFLFLYMTTLAYLTALVVYQGGLYFFGS